MRFHETPLKGAFLIDLEPIKDKRGFFARSWCSREFELRGLPTRLAQCNISYSRFRGTLRGLHFQTPPHAEAKVVRCIRGAAFDVVVDLRYQSPTFSQWFAVELTADNRRAMYIPEGFAHGFQTLEDDTELFYQMAEFYHADAASGLRWDDPQVQIDWPAKKPIISDKDAGWPTLETLGCRVVD